MGIGSHGEGYREEESGEHKERGRTEQEAREATENTGQELRTETAETKSAVGQGRKDEKGLKHQNLQLLQGPAPGEGRNTRTEILKHRGRHVRGTGKGGGEDTTKIERKYHGTGAETNSAGEDTTNRKRR